MISSWRSKGLTASLCGTAVLAAWAVAGAPHLNSPRINKLNLAPISDHSTTSVRANTDSVGALQAATAMVKAELLAVRFGDERCRSGYHKLEWARDHRGLCARLACDEHKW